MNTIPDVAVGAIAAACIAAILSFLGLVASKELKTSEFRQYWIDSVREDVAIFIAAASKLGPLIVVKEKDSEIETQKTECFEKMNLSVCRLKLRLNPDEDFTIDIMKHIEIMGESLREAKAGDSSAHQKYHKAANDLTVETSRLLKKEWKRVKVGEPIFRFSKWAALAMVVTVLGVAAWAIFLQPPLAG